jgi:hypothetical protein
MPIMLDSAVDPAILAQGNALNRKIRHSVAYSSVPVAAHVLAAIRML